MLECEKAGHRPASADRQPALLAKAAILRSQPSAPSPLGSRPSGSRSGAGEMAGRLRRPPSLSAASSRPPARRGAGVRANLSIPSYAAFQAPCVASGGTRGRALQALKQKIGPLGLRFPPLRGGASVFHLAPRCPPSASWGLRRRLRRGWTGEGRASLSPTMMDPALVGPGCFRWPRYRASVCCSGSPKRIGISSRKQ